MRIFGLVSCFSKHLLELLHPPSQKQIPENELLCAYKSKINHVL